MRMMKSLTSDPGDSLLNIAPAAAAAAKRHTDNNRKWKAVKASISSPCCFSHVTQLDRAEAASIMHCSSSATAPFQVV